MKWKFTFLILLALVFAALNVSGQQSITYYVSAANGNDANGGTTSVTAFKSVRKALASMRANSTTEINILVEKGTYYPYDENGPLDNVADDMFLMCRNEASATGKKLRVLGGYDFATGSRDFVNNLTYLSGGGKSRHVVVVANVPLAADSIEISGFTVTGASALPPGPEAVTYFIGLTLLSRYGAGFTIQNCINNKLLIRNCVISENKAANGAGVFCYFSKADFQNCVFSENNAYIAESDVSPIITGEGGGAYIMNAEAKFQNCVFFRNGAENQGSAIKTTHTGQQKVIINNCSFHNNRYLSTNTTAIIHKRNDGDMQITNTIIQGTAPFGYPGGISLEGTKAQNGDPSTGDIFLSNVFVNLVNDTVYATGTVYNRDQNEYDFNSTFTNNPVIYYTFTSPYKNEGNPRGPDEKWFTRDDGLQLYSCSIVDAPFTAALTINRGDNKFSTLTTDIMGRPRIDDGKIDLGAYEDPHGGPKLYWEDYDRDGYGDGGKAPVIRVDCDTSYVTNGDDCKDVDSTIHPGATEICDGIDNNCDGQIDEGAKKAYVPDADGDGYGRRGATPVLSCTAPAGYVLQTGDCNDNDNTIYPDAPEICADGKDNDCNGFVDDVLLTLNYPDNDGDGFGDRNGIGRLFCGPEPGYSLNNSDCNDTNKDMYPGAPEICDGIDNNCNGQIDEGLTKAYWPDADGDGYGQLSVAPVLSCTPIAGYVTGAGDCDDNDPAVHDHAIEICDGKDNDCDGQIDNHIAGPRYYPDNDGDGHGDKSFNADVRCPLTGYVTSNDDCNDNDPSVYPGAFELCDGKDNNCDGKIDEGVLLEYYIDTDGDGWGTGAPVESCVPLQGYALRGGDCNDNDNTIYPNAPELCDGKDNNCNGQFDENIKVNYYVDADGDGFGSSSNPILSCTPVAGRITAAGDCNDNDNTIYPGAPEICDGKDNNCNGQIDNEVSQQIRYYRDSDADGYGYSQDFVVNCNPVAGRVLIGGDCDDNDNTIYPGVGGCASLPLTLVDFTIKEEGQKAIAYWSTTDEINTHHFELERSEDGNQFKAIGTVAAMNAPGDHNYRYVDAQPLSGKNYYRIKMVDIDGTYTYSRIASLHANGYRVTSSIYPNPASDIVNVVINESSNNLSIQLISLDGKVLQTKQYAVRGTHQLNVAKLPAGIYFIKVSNGGIHKLIKQ